VFKSLSYYYKFSRYIFYLRQ